jgi:hypothetical protein
MTAKRLLLCAFAPMLLIAFQARVHSASAQTPDLSLVKRALAAELESAQDTRHPMRYRLRKTNPRLSTTKEIFETCDGAVGRLIAINDKPLNANDEQKEQARLDSLLSDPSRQRHRKQAEDEDLARVVKLLRALPDAFTYSYLGSGAGPTGKIEKFAFEPNPAFDPPDLETEVLTAMAGEIWIDASQERVVRLEGHLQRDVDFGWGILGRLNKDGWIVIEQSDVSDQQWRTVRLQMAMTGRILLKTRSFETTEEESQFEAVPAGLSYVQAIRILKSNSGAIEEAGR